MLAHAKEAGCFHFLNSGAIVIPVLCFSSKSWLCLWVAKGGLVTLAMEIDWEQLRSTAADWFLAGRSVGEGLENWLVDVDQERGSSSNPMRFSQPYCQFINLRSVLLLVWRTWKNLSFSSAFWLVDLVEVNFNLFTFMKFLNLALLWAVSFKIGSWIDARV